ncbi:hypothetical protein E4U46_002514 [Claviceps purpurea]|nr:hypothetical protein E4U46_002514 [Claviceps purpurea]
MALILEQQNESILLRQRIQELERQIQEKLESVSTLLAVFLLCRQPPSGKPTLNLA